MSIPTLNPLEFPLAGSHLIEASAGTGKTTAITDLYLRLVLGHGREMGLMPPQILVVTFTEAATQELCNRIRSRLAGAAEWFRAPPPNETAEVVPVPNRSAFEIDFAERLRSEYPASQWSNCARQLELAAEWMDEAAVFTIHGWAYRMLREHAFASDNLFDQTLLSDQSHQLAEAVRDYWRQFISVLDSHKAASVMRWCKDPERLLQRVLPLLNHSHQLGEELSPAKAIDLGMQNHIAWVSELKNKSWLSMVDDFELMLEAAADRQAFDQRKLQPATVRKWLAALRTWAKDMELVKPGLGDSAWERLTPAGLAAAWKEDPPPQHDLLEALETLKQGLATPPDDGVTAFLAHAASWIQRRFESAKARRSEMGFDDLLTRLSRALRATNNEALGELIRKQFPVVMIDEFQDTDPTQYDIFDAVYDISSNRSDVAVVMIGDPKQAIYAFRGADIYTYLEARSACADRLYTLRRNYRASTTMVEAVNRCFSTAESRPTGSGAFRFRKHEQNPLPFEPAIPNGITEYLWVSHSLSPDTVSAALTLWLSPTAEDGKPLNKVDDRHAIAESFASQIVGLLNASTRSEAGFVDDAGNLRPVRAGDVAVLVNNREEAVVIREAMRKRGLRSVYLSDRDSVFETSQAADLELILQAVAEPDDALAVRSALATQTLSLPPDTLDQLAYDEGPMEARIAQFRGYRDRWQRQGVLPMLRYLLHDFAVPARLLADRTSGERVLTNLLHLAELLQQASRGFEGEHVLVRYLREQREGDVDGNAKNTPQIRLESDASLVQVVTIHKSKGLQYPLVYLPFAAEAKVMNANSRQTVMRWHDSNGNLRLSPIKNASTFALADEERLAEDIRKLYVALTRAKYAAWVGVSPRRAIADSALGYLLGAESADDLGRVFDDIEETEHTHVAIAPAPTSDMLVTDESQSNVFQAHHYDGQPRENWWIASYSGLRDRGKAGSPFWAQSWVSQSDARDSVILDDEVPLTAPSVSTGDEASATVDIEAVHDFPRGAGAGSFLHDCLEWAAGRGFNNLLEDSEPLRDAIARRCQVRGWDKWIDPVTDWVLALLSYSLPPNLRLADATATSAELEFFVGVHNCSITKLDQLITEPAPMSLDRPSLEPGTINGMLKGFIDLVFEHGGRYYVADYKSTWLGPDDSFYQDTAIEHALLAGRYDLQSMIYLLALHRLLSARLPDYDYDRHIGGALTIFLRGINAPNRGVHFDRPSFSVITALDREMRAC